MLPTYRGRQEGEIIQKGWGGEPSGSKGRDLGVGPELGVGETEPRGMAFCEEGTAKGRENPGRASTWYSPRDDIPQRVQSCLDLLFNINYTSERGRQMGREETARCCPKTRVLFPVRSVTRAALGASQPHSPAP